MGGPNVIELTDSDFGAQVLQADQPVLVDFWAPWCGPCRQIAPLIDQLATENAGSIKFAKVNVDDSPSTAEEYGVSSIPTLMIFKGGEVAHRFVGVQPKSRLQQALDSVVKLALYPCGSHGIENRQVGRDLLELLLEVFLHMGGRLERQRMSQNTARFSRGEVRGQLFDRCHECRAHAEAAQSHAQQEHEGSWLTGHFPAQRHRLAR
jgi:thioredoxin 1